MSVASDALNDLLDQERQLIRARDLDRLQRLLPRKEQLLTRIQEDAPAADVLEELREKSRLNATLLAAMAKGIKAALQQVRTAKDASSQKTYDQDGHRSSMSKNAEAFARKL